MQHALPDHHATIVKDQQGLFFNYQAIDNAKVALLPQDTQAQITTISAETKQHALAKIAVLPAIMCACYIGLILYFKSRGGYKAEVLTGHAAEDEKFTGGTAGPGEG